MTHTIKNAGAVLSFPETDIPVLVKTAPEKPLPMPVLKQLSTWLDVNIQSHKDLANVCHRGVEAGQFYRFRVEHQWLGEETLDYVVSPSSLSYARSRNQILGAVETSKCVALMKIVALAQYAFDEPEEVSEWFSARHWDFQDKTPLELFKVDGGTELMVDELLNMEVVCL